MVLCLTSGEGIVVAGCICGDNKGTGGLDGKNDQ